MICQNLNPKKMLATIKSRRDIKYSRQLMLAELLQNAERSERQIGEIKARAKLLEKQVEEWCAENQNSVTDSVSNTKPQRFSNAQGSQNEKGSSPQEMVQRGMG